MPQAVNSNLLLYADDSCLKFQHKDVQEIEKVLYNDFENIYDWFVDNKLSIHFISVNIRPNRFSLQVNVKSKL